MTQFHIRHLIKIATFSCLFFALNTGSAFAAQWATVVAEKAVVYSDREMTSPIGYIRKGRKLRVGEIARNKGRILPVIVNKKVAYIRVSDIQTTASLAQLSSARERVNKQANLVLEEKKIGVFFGTYLAAVSFPESATNENNYNLLLFGGGLRGYHHNFKTNRIWRVGTDYFRGSKDDERLAFVNIQADILNRLHKTSVYKLSWYAGGSVIPFAEYKLGSLFTVNGYGGGVQAGVEFEFNFWKDWSIHLDGGWQFIKLIGFDLPENATLPSTLEPSLNGIKALATVTYSY